MKSTSTLKAISKKITLLNQTTLDSMIEGNDKTIIKNFTETGTKILEADFGFAWWKFIGQKEYELAYKSPNTPYTPTTPREKAGNYIAQTTKRPFFDSNIKSENYEFDILRYLKTYIIIPIFYGENTYGNLVLCYKKKHHFTSEELTLAQALGNATAQAITIHKYIETDILLAQEKMKTEFISNITHELRTPLAIMRGHIYLAKKNKQENPGTTLSALKVIDSEIVRLSEMLSDLVLVTSGSNLPVHFGTIDIYNIVSSVEKRLKVSASKKGVRITVKKKAGATSVVIGDNKYLDRMFLNIIKNAITYGRSKIIIEILNDKNEVLVKISDDGIGIAKEDLSKIFERFYRADKSRTRSENRTGLGLSIAKKIAEMHGGKIDVKSALRKGSTFIVTLPKIPGKALKKG